MARQLLESELSAVDGLEITRNVPLAPLTTFHIGGKARLFLVPRTIRALEQALFLLKRYGQGYRILGNGSNLLIDDAGVDMVLSLGGLNRYLAPQLQFAGGLEFIGVTAEAGVPLQRLLAWAVKNGLSGLERLAGIPGSVGGAVSMNAGANGMEISSIIDAVLFTFPGESQWYSREALRFEYRRLVPPDDALVSAVRFSLMPYSISDLMCNVRMIMGRRRSTQPIGSRSAGCVFKNPEGDSAGRLIEMCGLKGKRIGDAQISSKHANFIVNLGQAGFGEVFELMVLAKETVFAQTGIVLAPEVAVWREYV
ncbi:MAG: UDP-N-acetylmuramate dehydrogenase [Dissulfuribacterales bacterium]